MVVETRGRRKKETKEERSAKKSAMAKATKRSTKADDAEDDDNERPPSKKVKILEPNEIQIDAGESKSNDEEEKSNSEESQEEEKSNSEESHEKEEEKDKESVREENEEDRDNVSSEDGGGGEAVQSPSTVSSETATEGDQGSEDSVSYQMPVKVGTRCHLKEFFETLEKLKPPLSRMERGWFVDHPQFKHLFHMPKYQNHKVQGMWMLLLRTAEIERRNEVWFIVNGVPVRYGLREHALISGLFCHNYPVHHKEKGDFAFVHKHFGVDGSVRLEDVKAKLIGMGPHKDRLKMAVLFFLSSIICGQRKAGAGAPNVLEIFQRVAPDLEYCKSFPWGRLSYEFMLDEIKQTAKKFRDIKGEVEFNSRWVVAGFCLPLELLAFECIDELRREFRESVKPDDKMCPRMCKSKFKKGDRKGFPLSEINKALGKTQDIDSLMVIDEKDKELLAEIYEEDHDDDVHDVVVESWSKRIRHGYTVFFEDIFKDDVDAREKEAPKQLLPFKEKRRVKGKAVAEEKVEMPPTELGEIMKTLQAIEQKVSGIDGRLTGLETSVGELKARINGDESD